MTRSNVLKLAAMEQEETPARAAEEILGDLADLGAEPNLNRVVDLTRELTGTLSDAGHLEATTVREHYISLLRSKISSPARFFDSAMVDAASSEKRADSGTTQGRKVSFQNPEPWPVQVNGSALLNDVAETLRRYVVLTQDQLVIVALWVVHSRRAPPGSPRLGHPSPSRRPRRSRRADGSRRTRALGR